MEKVDESALTSVLSTLVHLDPFQAMDSGEIGFLWITEILNSGYQERQRMWLANELVELLGKHFFHRDQVHFIDTQPAWIPPLLGFLSLSEKLDATRSTRFVALRILATSPRSVDFGPMILPILASLLLPTHPLQARFLALRIFVGFTPGWFSPQMENIPSKDLEQLVQAVGDPFQFLDLPLQDGKPVDPPNYDPMMAMAVLLEFASSDPWRNHLRRSHFTTFEEMISTGDGKRTVHTRMLEIATHLFPEFLCTAAKISMVIGRLEDLQCLNTVEVIVRWAWTVGVVNPVDHDGWRLIGRDTLRFYQTHGMERLTVLKRHVAERLMYLSERYRRESGLDIFLELPVLKNMESRYNTYLNLSKACQLGRLYQLFGYDPTTWKEVVVVEEVGEKPDVSSKRSVDLVPSMDWTCDYP